MLAATVSVTSGTLTTINVPADVGSVRIFSPDVPENLQVNIPGVHGSQFVQLADITLGDEFSRMNGIRTINLQSLSGSLTAVAFATRK